MSSNNDEGNNKKGNFWTTLPGILTQIIGVITAVITLIAAIQELSEKRKSSTENSPTPPSVTPTSTVTPTPNFLAQTGCTTVVNDPDPPLNVRSGPGTTYPTVGTLTNGTPVTVTENNAQGWLRISSPLPGWVAQSRTVCK
jgi:uncharacterized protein YgiM (DUF1202 family)